MSKTLKYNIKTLKKKCGVSYGDIAELCRVSRQSAIEWANITENDSRSIPSDKLLSLSMLFHVSMEEMYNRIPVS